MGLYIVEIHGEIEGDCEIIKKYEEPRKGHWIDTEFKKLKECSICHARWGIYSIEDFDFCPNCGCKMAEGEG